MLPRHLQQPPPPSVRRRLDLVRRLRFRFPFAKT
ncbi:hypothetical protein LINPERPRIM_LOCUS38032 [Linum perenne]